MGHTVLYMSKRTKAIAQNFTRHV